MFSIARSAVKTENGMKWIVAGWLLFIVSALFLVASLLFLVPIVRRAD